MVWAPEDIKAEAISINNTAVCSIVGSLFIGLPFMLKNGFHFIQATKVKKIDNPFIVKLFFC